MNNQTSQVYIAQVTPEDYVIRIEDSAGVKEVSLSPVEFAKAITGKLAHCAKESEVSISQLTTGSFMIRIEDGAGLKETFLTPEEFSKAITGKFAKGTCR